MDAARWRRVDELFAAALERPAAERRALLARESGDDDELRREVESLLAHHRDDDFLEDPACEEAVRLLARGDGEAGEADAVEAEDLGGRRLGRFEVVEKIGAGGMGAVYLAVDPDLERRVAVKLLPAHLAGDAERIRRFRREVLAVSALNHPNILTVHEVAQVEGRELLVSELVDGVTLRRHLGAGPLPPTEALGLALQVARGLEAAHHAGIVHRDVKPENLMLRADGLVKLLDFGIATNRRAPAAGEAAAGDGGGELSAPSLTGEGVVLGTASYLSPERARGEPAGEQSDVWGLGCVLYECLAGGAAFPGTVTAEVVAAVLTRQPDWEALPAATSPAVRRLLRRCLEKDPARRLHAMADVRLELEEILDGHSEPAGAADGRGDAGRRLSWTAAVAGALVLAVVTAVGLGGLDLWRTVERPPPRLRFEIPHPPEGRFGSSVESTGIAFSPDGTRLGFVVFGADGSSAIWVHVLADLAAHPVKGTEEARTLFWSPDGGSIGFVADGKLKRVAVGGGQPVVLCDVDTGGPVSGSWGRDAILFASAQSEVLYRISPDGGKTSVALRADAARGETRVAWPWFLPDGERFLYLAFQARGGAELRLAGPGTAPRTVAPISSRVELVAPGYAVFAREGALLAQRFDAERAVLTGAAVPISPAVRSFASTGAATFATAWSGTVALAAQESVDRLFLFDPAGKALGSVGEAMSGAYSIAASPDGQRAIVERQRPALDTLDLWMLDLDRGLADRLTDEPGTEAFAQWWPDGRSIVYSATRGASRICCGATWAPERTGRWCRPGRSRS